MTTKIAGIADSGRQATDRSDSYRAARTLRRLLAEMPRRGGGLHRHIMKCAVCARAAGFSQDNAVREIDTVANQYGARPGEVNEAVAKAFGHVYVKPKVASRSPTGRPSGNRVTSTAPQPISQTTIQRRFGEQSARELMDLSPIPIPNSPRAQTRAVLQALYKPDDIVLIGSTYAKRPKRISDWILLLNNSERIGPLIMPNVLTGRTAPTKSGKLSFRCDGAVAWPARYLTVEFDELALTSQAAVIGKLIDAGMVDCVVYSGSKSLHCWLRVDARNPGDWNDRVRGIHGRLIRYGADPSTGNPSRLSRLPGGVRSGKESKVQSLLYLRGDPAVAPAGPGLSFEERIAAAGLDYVSVVERAAILEFAAGLPEREAEEQALREFGLMDHCSGM